MKYENKLLQLILNKINEQKQQRGGENSNNLLKNIQKGLEKNHAEYDFENNIFKVLYCIFSKRVNKEFTNQLRTELNSDSFVNFLETEKQLLAMIFMYTNFNGLFQELSLDDLSNAMKYILSTCLKLRLEQTQNFNDTTDISKVNKTKFIINFFLFYEKKQDERTSNGKLLVTPKEYYTGLYTSLEQKFTNLSTKDIFVKMIGTENRVESVKNLLNMSNLTLTDLLQNLFNLKERENSNQNSKAGVDKVFEDGNYLIRKSTLDYKPSAANETIDNNLNAFLDEYSLFGDKVIQKFRDISKEFNEFFMKKCNKYLEQASQPNSRFTNSYRRQLTDTYNSYSKMVGNTAVTYYNIYLLLKKEKYIPKIDKEILKKITTARNEQVRIYKNSLGINTEDYNNALVNKKYAEKVGHLENARRVLKRRKQGNTITNKNVYNGLQFFKRPIPNTSVQVPNSLGNFKPPNQSNRGLRNPNIPNQVSNNQANVTVRPSSNGTVSLFNPDGKLSATGKQSLENIIGQYGVNLIPEISDLVQPGKNATELNKVLKKLLLTYHPNKAGTEKQAQLLTALKNALNKGSTNKIAKNRFGEQLKITNGNNKGPNQGNNLGQNGSNKGLSKKTQLNPQAPNFIPGRTVLNPQAPEFHKGNVGFGRVNNSVKRGTKQIGKTANTGNGTFRIKKKNSPNPLQ